MPVVEFVVERENHGSDEDYEESLIGKSIIVSSLLSFSGLMLAAYMERSFTHLNLLMIFLIFFK